LQNSSYVAQDINWVFSAENPEIARLGRIFANFATNVGFGKSWASITSALPSSWLMKHGRNSLVVSKALTSVGFIILFTNSSAGKYILG
jgi:hypothetical protein